MKRFLLLFCAVMLVCSIMIVPAFAAETISAVGFSDFMAYLPSEVPSGYYTLSLFADGDTLHGVTFVSEPFFVGEYIGDDVEMGFITSPVSFGIKDDIDGVGTVDVLLVFAHFNDPDVGEFNCLIIESGEDSYFTYYEDGKYSLDLTPVEPEPGSPISSVLDVFSGIGSWITGQLSAATSLFWNSAAGELTFMGVLVVLGLAFAVIFLLIGIFQRFLRFGG